MSNLYSEEFLAVVRLLTILYGLGCCASLGILIYGIVLIVKGKRNSIDFDPVGVRTVVIATLVLLVTLWGALTCGIVAYTLALRIG